MKEYTVHMVHKMRSTVTVKAENEEQAKALAYAESFDDESGWEEIDTDYGSIYKSSKNYCAECDAEIDESEELCSDCKEVE